MQKTIICYFIITVSYHLYPLIICHYAVRITSYQAAQCFAFCPSFMQWQQTDRKRDLNPQYTLIATHHQSITHISLSLQPALWAGHPVPESVEQDRKGGTDARMDRGASGRVKVCAGYPFQFACPTLKAVA